MPCRASRRDVTRVSSAAIAETSPRTRSARALRSSRLPIGVATTYSLLTRPHPARPRGGGATFPSEWGRECSNPFEPRAHTIRHLRAGADVARRGGQHIEKRLAVVASEDSVVEDHHRAAVGRTANQPAEPLLESQRRLRQSELRKRIADQFGARGVNGIRRDRKRQADHDHAAQALARDVDPLPEGRRPEQKGPPSFLKCLEQLAPLTVDALAANQHLVEVDPLLQRRVHVAQLPVRGEQRPRAPTPTPGYCGDNILYPDDYRSTPGHLMVMRQSTPGLC